MKLRELCSEFKYECLSGSMDVDVRDVIYDSRKITEGTVFVCMVGAVTDGHKYIPDAVKRVRRRSLSSVPMRRSRFRIKSRSFKWNQPDVRLPTCRRRCSDIRTVSWSRIGITGTKGKTTTTYMIKSVLEMAGKKVGLIGTIRRDDR